jgi:hypothetical protein
VCDLHNDEKNMSSNEVRTRQFGRLCLIGNGRRLLGVERSHNDHDVVEAIIEQRAFFFSTHINKTNDDDKQQHTMMP